MLAFGGHLTGFQVVNYFARNADNALIGWRWGDTVLGLYGRAYQLLLLPLSQINAPIASVAIPALSRLQNHEKHYRTAYLQLLRKLAMLTIPPIALTIVCADWIVHAVLGPQWDGAAKIFVWLGLAALLQPITYTSGWLFISQGRTREQLAWGVVGSGIIVLSFLIGLHWGAIGVSIAYAICINLIATPLLLWYVGRRGPVTTADLYRVCGLPLLAAMCVCSALLIFRFFVTQHGIAIDLSVCVGLSIVATLLCYASFAQGRQTLRESWRLMREIFAAG
jgi:PST family polysaccharide transporter